MNRIKQLEGQLNNFSLRERQNALTELLAHWEVGEVHHQPESEALNVHAHSFFSYNAYAYSPSALAWLAKKNGFCMIGIVDFDTLDGVDEFLNACEFLDVRGIAGIETRVFIPEFSEVEINSPGEVGVAYHMGTGFISSQVPDYAKPELAELRQRAEIRNRQILEKVNPYLSPLVLDYETEILPLTPGGYVTERHLVQKIVQKADQALLDPAGFWMEKLDISRNESESIMQDRTAFHSLLRRKLMKREGVAYVQPEAGAFSSVDSFHAILDSAEAIPCYAWLDGTSQGEQNIERLLDLLMEKGVRALNIVPDRNWNITNADLKARKIKQLYRIVQLADDLGLPILIGTEMNSPGQKHVDDFDAPEIASLKDSFSRGAYTIYGHTRLQRLWGMGLRSDWSRKSFLNQKTRNDFYESVGRVIPASWRAGNVHDWINQDLAPKEVAEMISQRT